MAEAFPAWPDAPASEPWWPGAAHSWPELLAWRVGQHPERLAVTYWADGEAPTQAWSYAELWRRIEGASERLQALGPAGERALLVYPPGLDFVVAYWGCLHAGWVPVPVVPPKDMKSLPKLMAIASDAQAKLALTDQGLMAQTRLLRWFQPALRAMKWHATDGWPEAPGGPVPWRLHPLALIQYTSGSTGQPKGVMLSHHNLLANAGVLDRIWRDSFPETPPERVVSWLPAFHDMGLIGMMLTPLMVGATAHFLSPLHVIQRPERWLWAMHRTQAQISTGPNFSYDLCVRRAGHLAPQLDLSHWKVAFNGAEPIQASTLQAFQACFGASGFEMSSFYPTYGLAEATLFVTGGRFQQTPVIRALPEEAQGLMRVGVGHPWMGTEVLVVHPERHEALPEGEEGELWIQGPSVAQGYWRKPELTEATFGARLADGRGPYLRTGDLGRWVEGQLFITGRIKDLVIVRGRNHYPQDLEHTMAEAHADLRTGFGVAFSVPTEGGEALVLVQEPRPDATSPEQELTQAIRGAIAQEHGLAPHAIHLLPPGTLPKTSSGKVQRQSTREAFLQGKLPRWKGPRKR